MSDPLRTTSTQVEAVNQADANFLRKMIDMLVGRRKLGYLDISDSEIETIARRARLISHEEHVDACRTCATQARALARIELGHPVDTIAASTEKCLACGKPLA